MKYINFNGNKISKLSLGTVQFGLNYGVANTHGKPDRSSVNEMINYVYKNGINCFDTAQAYGNSEEVLGESLINKEGTFIVSKLKSEFFKTNLINNLNISLSNLQQKSVFGLLLHDSKLLYEWKQEYFTIIDKLIENKKIEYFGVSIYTNDDFKLAINNDKIKIIQIPFNVFDQRAITKKWFVKAKEANKLIFIRSIFLQGLFFMNKHEFKGNLVKAKPYLDKMNTIRKGLGLTISEFAMTYVDSVTTDSVLLFGCDNLKQAEENIHSYNHLPILDKSILNEITDTFLEVPEDIFNPVLWSKQ